MSASRRPAYRFATEAHWQACHFAGADRRTSEARKGLRPFAPFALPPRTLWTGAAFAPTIGDNAELLWRDDAGTFFRLPYPDTKATGAPAPAGIVSATRMVAGPGLLWTLEAGGPVLAFDKEGLAHLFAAELGGLSAIDLTSDSSDGIYLLGSANQQTQVIHLSCAGNRDSALAIDDVTDATGLAFLGVRQTLVVLASAGAKLHFVDVRSGQKTQTVQLASLRPCFEVTAIGGDNCSRFYIAGTDKYPVNGQHRVLIVDQDGNLLGTLPVGDEVTGITATRSQLFLTTGKGVLRFDPASTVPQGVGEVKATVVTPQLRSPAKGPQKWMRVDARVELPLGCSIRIACASAKDAGSGERARQALENPILSPGQLAEWREGMNIRVHVYDGDSRASGEVVLSAPLHDVREDLIWIEVTLIAAPGGRLPVLSELTILYPGSTLIEHLPAIYRAGELDSGDFTRALVGVLEVGTQGLDAKIGKLGRKIHPKSADSAWLDYVASWLGLPWDNALSVDQKRRIVSRASAIADGYSTRSGLEEMLESLIPGTPRRFRVTDMTAEFGLATIAGKGCDGSRLPAVLAGLPLTASELGNKAILGKARLPCGVHASASARLTGQIRIDIAATAEERAAWSPWLKGLVEAMLPVTAHAELRWLGPAELSASRISEDSRIMEEPAARLGTDAVTGASRLGGRARTILPNNLTPDSTLQ